MCARECCNDRMKKKKKHKVHKTLPFETNFVKSRKSLRACYKFNKFHRLQRNQKKTRQMKFYVGALVSKTTRGCFFFEHLCSLPSSKQR